MPGSDSKSIYSLIGIAGALVGERISDVLGFDFLSVGSLQHRLIDHWRASNAFSS
jgi:hypothetical protein